MNQLSNKLNKKHTWTKTSWNAPMNEIKDIHMIMGIYIYNHIYIIHIHQYSCPSDFVGRVTSTWTSAVCWSIAVCWEHPPKAQRTRWCWLTMARLWLELDIIDVMCKRMWKGQISAKNNMIWWYNYLPTQSHSLYSFAQTSNGVHAHHIFSCYCGFIMLRNFKNICQKVWAEL